MDQEKNISDAPQAADEAQRKLNRWQAYQQYQGATERVLRTLNLTEALSLMLLFFSPPAAHYGFLPISGMLWIVLLFGGEQFSRQVEARFPHDLAMRAYVNDADARTANPLRWWEFFRSSNGRLFALALLQAAVILYVLFAR